MKTPNPPDFVPWLRAISDNALQRARMFPDEHSAELTSIAGGFAELCEYFSQTDWPGVPETAALAAKDRLLLHRTLFRRRAEILGKVREAAALLRAFATLSSNEDDAEFSSKISGLEDAASKGEQLFANFVDNVLGTVIEGFLTADVDRARLLQTAQLIDTKPLDEKLLLIHMARMLTTDDIIGVLLRSHVLLERSLNELMEAYSTNNTDVLQDPQLGFSLKLRLATMLGLVTQDESALATRLNSIRNKIAHYKTLRYVFDVGKERELWAMFTSLQSFASETWPTYDATKFPTFLTYATIFLYVTWGKRVEILSGRQHAAEVVGNAISGRDDLDLRMLPVPTLLLVKALQAVGGEILFAPPVKNEIAE